MSPRSRRPWRLNNSLELFQRSVSTFTSLALYSLLSFSSLRFLPSLTFSVPPPVSLVFYPSYSLKQISCLLVVAAASIVVGHPSCFPASLAAIIVTNSSVAFAAGHTAAPSAVQPSAITMLPWLGMQAALLWLLLMLLCLCHNGCSLGYDLPSSCCQCGQVLKVGQKMPLERSIFGF